MYDVKFWDLCFDNVKGDGIYVGGVIFYCMWIDLFNVLCDGNYC